MRIAVRDTFRIAPQRLEEAIPKGLACMLASLDVESGTTQGLICAFTSGAS